MKFTDLFEKTNYDKKHKCLTPGAVYSTTFHDNEITISVTLPDDITISKKQSEDLEVKLHYAVEKQLKDLF